MSSRGGDQPAAEEVEEPCPDHQGRQEKLAGCGHEEQPNAADDGRRLGQGRRWGYPEREKGYEGHDGILNIHLPPPAPLEPPYAIPQTERGLQTGDIIYTWRQDFGVRFAAATSAMVAGRETVEDGLVKVGQEKRERRSRLGIAGRGPGELAHGGHRPFEVDVAMGSSIIIGYVTTETLPSYPRLAGTVACPVGGTDSLLCPVKASSKSRWGRVTRTCVGVCWMESE